MIPPLECQPFECPGSKPCKCAYYRSLLLKVSYFFVRSKRILMIDWLIYILYCFTSRSRIFHSYGDGTITSEGLQNLGLRVCSALRAFEQGGIFVVPHLLWHGTSFFRSHSNDCPIKSPLTTHKEMWGIYFNPDFHGSQEEKRKTLLKITGPKPNLKLTCVFF
jgi:hypothetical protein